LTSLKIGIAGTHSTGKSTFVKALQERFRECGVGTETVADLAIAARDAGFPILREHTFESTAWIICRGISLELEATLRARVVLIDRPVPDALGYLRAALQWRRGSISSGQTEYLETLVRLHASTYHRMFLTTIDSSIPIDTSQERDMEPTFRQMASDSIGSVFRDLKLPHSVLPVAEREMVAAEVVSEVERLLFQ
jgi:deoxyadenosine/deoxycytidine kinase